MTHDTYIGDVGGGDGPHGDGEADVTPWDDAGLFGDVNEASLEELFLMQGYSRMHLWPVVDEEGPGDEPEDAKTSEHSTLQVYRTVQDCTAQYRCTKLVISHLRTRRRHSPSLGSRRDILNTLQVYTLYSTSTLHGKSVHFTVQYRCREPVISHLTMASRLLCRMRHLRRRRR